MRAHGASADDLAGAADDAGVDARVAAAVARTRALLDEGRPLCDAVRGRLGYELRATWLGGTRILDRLEAVRVRRDSSPSVARRGGRAMVRVAHAGLVAGRAVRQAQGEP